MSRTARISSTVNPYEDRASFTIIDTWSPNIQDKTILFVHWFSNKLVAKAIIRLTIAVVPLQTLILWSLRTINFTLSQFRKLVRCLWRHKPLRLCITDSFKREDVTILIALNRTIDSLYAGVWTSRDRLRLYIAKCQRQCQK